ncbi:MAG: HlyD family efflux transporter periplasmic adaptor subunit, partial [Christensenellaceae bacterium]
KVMNELIEIQTKIEQYQENEMLKDVQDPKLQEVNTQITQKSEEINHIINGEQDGDLVLAERELKDLMTQKQQYLRESVAADQQLQDFYSQEKQLLERVDAWREMVSAPQAGVVSFYLDGAESVLNAANIKKITSADVTDILNGSTVKQEVTVDSEAEKPLFRLVNNFKWFLIAKSDTPIDELSNSTVISIAFDDYLDKQYTGTVVGSVAEENTYIYAIEIADDIGALLNTRRTDAKIFTKFEGFKVPKNAIKTREDMIGVYVVTGHDRTFVPVDIKIEKDGYAIITPLSQNSILSVNQHVEV